MLKWFQQGFYSGFGTRTLVLGMIFLFAFMCWIQTNIDKIEKHPPQERLLYLPSGRYLSLVSLGYDQVVADVLWIKTILYFGSHLMTDKTFTWLDHMLNIVISLDPDYEYPYYFGGLILALDANEIAKSNAILRKGMKRFPDTWQFPFYIGFNAMYYLQDNLTAAKYIAMAAENQKAPDFVRTLPALLYKKAGKSEQGLIFLEQLYENTEDKSLKERIKDKIIDIMNEEKP